jgi:peptidoglycan/xylan/chitin deacetylase (PgdA/CDA1 family)
MPSDAMESSIRGRGVAGASFNKRGPARGGFEAAGALPAGRDEMRGVMARISRAIIGAGLETLYFSGTHHLARPFLSGVGCILTFHRVRPSGPEPFQPNRLLEITPDFLGDVIESVRSAGSEIVSLDEVERRLKAGDFSRHFVALTFDDGYRDNLEHAYPVLKEKAAPFTIFVPSAFADGSGHLWWVELERAIAGLDRASVEIDGELRTFDCATPAAKEATFDELYWWMREMQDEARLRAAARHLACQAGIDADGICPELCMGWEELAGLAACPLVTIGAHTENHLMLKKASARTVAREMRVGVDRIEAMLGFRPRHFSFPVGDASSAGPREFAIAAASGFATAVTTRPGVLFEEHGEHLTALPRISVNGSFQRLRYLDVLLSGAATALKNGFRRVDAA